MSYDDRRRRLAALEGIPCEEVRQLEAGHSRASWAEERDQGVHSDAQQFAASTAPQLPLPLTLTREAIDTLLAPWYAANHAWIPCARCGYPCQCAPAATDRPDIALLRGRSTVGVGVCPSCNITAFLQDPALPFAGMYATMTPEARAAMLQRPEHRVAVTNLVLHQPGGVGLMPEQISWERVALFWHLPHPEGTYGTTRRRRK